MLLVLSNISLRLVNSSVLQEPPNRQQILSSQDWTVVVLSLKLDVFTLTPGSNVLVNSSLFLGFIRVLTTLYTCSKIADF